MRNILTLIRKNKIKLFNLIEETEKDTSIEKEWLKTSDEYNLIQLNQVYVGKTMELNGYFIQDVIWCYPPNKMLRFDDLFVRYGPDLHGSYTSFSEKVRLATPKEAALFKRIKKLYDMGDKRCSK